MRRPWCLRLRVMIVSGGVVPNNIIDATGIVPWVLQCAIPGNPVFRAKLLPKFPTDLVSALPHLQGDDLSGHGGGGGVVL